MPTSEFARAPRLSLAAPLRPPSVVRPPLTTAQRAHLDALAVDRSHFAWYPLPRWSHEGETGDAWLAEIHRETTEADRIEAWRCFFRGVDGNGRPLIKRGHWWWARPW